MKLVFFSFILFISFSASAISQEQKLKQSDAIVTMMINRLKLNQNVVLQSQNLVARSQVSPSSSTKEKLRETWSFRLSHQAANSGLGEVKVLVSGPLGFLNSGLKYPVVFIAGGFQTGQQSISFIKDPGEKILVGFDYPHTPEELMAQPDLLLSTIYRTPPQMALALVWLHQQSWVMQNQINLISISLGTLFLPITMRIAERLGVLTHKSVFAFGGADYGIVFSVYLEGKVSSEIKNYIIKTMQGLLSPYDPQLHLPFIKGQFLVIRALQDEVFPEVSGVLLEQLLPQPKLLKQFNTRHINTDRFEIIEMTLKEVESFLN
jgi:hypothetical protein